MEWIATINLTVTVLGFLVTGFVLAIGGVWKLAQMEKRQSEELKKDRTEINKHIDEVRDLALDQANLARREFGETVRAIQQKVGDNEVKALETFVRRDSFHQLMAADAGTMKAQFDRIDVRFDRMESKLDVLQQQQQQRTMS